MMIFESPIMKKVGWERWLRFMHAQEEGGH